MSGRVHIHDPRPRFVGIRPTGGHPPHVGCGGPLLPRDEVPARLVEEHALGADDRFCCKCFAVVRAGA